MQNSKRWQCLGCCFVDFFSYTLQDRRLQCTQTHLYYTRKLYHYELLRRLDRQIPESNEVIIGILLSTGTPPTTHWIHKGVKSLENSFSQGDEPRT